MPQPAGERLDSWKEIAAYLGRDLRTVRRWEKDKGLPVHRVPGGERQAVFAYRSEIDKWLLHTEASSPEQDTPATVASSESQIPNFSSAVGDPVIAVPPTQASWLQKPIFTFRRAIVAIAVLALIAAIAVCVVLLNKQTATNRLDKVVFSGNSVQAWGPTGKLLWTYSFDSPLDEEGKKEVSRIQIVDVTDDGPRNDRRKDDGQKQVLVMAPLHIEGVADFPGDVLFSFSADGRLLWRFDFHDVFRYAGRDLVAPWGFGALHVDHESGESDIWAAVDSFLWSPGSLIKFDRNGRLLGKFVNWGHIHSLGHFASSKGAFLLVGGINNECNCAMLAILKENSPSGSSPSIASRESICENCPEGRPYRYILFPRSEIAVATGFTYNQVRGILSSETGIQIDVQETIAERDWEMYELSPDFEPRSFTASDHIFQLHQELEAQGKIGHSLDKCPELSEPRPVKVWSPEHGWKTGFAEPTQTSTNPPLPKRTGM